MYQDFSSSITQSQSKYANHLNTSNPIKSRVRITAPMETWFKTKQNKLGWIVSVILLPLIQLYKDYDKPRGWLLTGQHNGMSQSLLTYTNLPFRDMFIIFPPPRITGSPQVAAIDFFPHMATPRSPRRSLVLSAATGGSGE